jgi:hypothetical protein
MRTRERALRAGLIGLGIVVAGASALTVLRHDFHLMSKNQTLASHQERFRQCWQATSIQEVSCVYPSLERWRVLDSAQLAAARATHLACLANDRSRLRVLLWLDSDSRVVRYLWLTGAQRANPAPTPFIPLATDYATVKRQFVRFSSCGVADLYDAVQQAGRWQLRRGCRLTARHTPAWVYCEPRTVQEGDPRTPGVWFLWETDATGRIVHRTVHGSW